MIVTAINIKTIINEKQNVNEIVSASVICCQRAKVSYELLPLLLIMFAFFFWCDNFFFFFLVKNMNWICQSAIRCLKGYASVLDN